MKTTRRPETKPRRRNKPALSRRELLELGALGAVSMAIPACGSTPDDDLRPVGLGEDGGGNTARDGGVEHDAGSLDTGEADAAAEDAEGSSDASSARDTEVDAEPDAAEVDASSRDADDSSDVEGPLDATPECAETEDNLEGPYYKPGAPRRSVLVEPMMPGTRLTLSGHVLRLDCSPVAGALLDFWQADDAGAYDDSGFRLRGQFTTDSSGAYELQTIIPGHYLNGNQYRPAHIHVKVNAPGGPILTTQLYFEGDPYNAVDPFIEAPLIMRLVDRPDGAKAATFDFAIRT